MKFTALDLDHKDDLINKMAAMADLLMNKHRLVAGNRHFRIAELEFYLSTGEGPYKDEVTHRNDRQLTHNQWYVHRIKNSDTLKSKNRIGMDLTCGDRSTNLFGGILIRAIQEYDAKEPNYIYGPARSFNALWGKETVEPEELSLLESQPADHNQVIALQKFEFKEEKPINCPRVLGKSAPLKEKQAPYRFLILPLKEHAGKEISIFPYLAEQKPAVDIKNLFGRNWK